MSPDQYKAHPFIKKLLKTSESFSDAFPNIGKFFAESESDFRGIAMFMGEGESFVAGLKVFDADGQPVVMWRSGETPLLAFINLDKSVGDEEFRVDKKALEGYSARRSTGSE